MSTKRSIRTLAATAAVLTCALAGCTDGSAQPKPLPSQTSTPDPTPTSSAVVSPSPTAPASATAPTLPPAARGTSEASAEAFVGYWIQVLNGSAESGSVRTLRSLSKQCVACTAISDFISLVYSDGGAIKGKGWDTQKVQVVGDLSRPLLRVDATVQVAPQTVVANKGAAPQAFPGGHRVKRFWLARSNGSWVARRLEQPE